MAGKLLESCSAKEGATADEVAKTIAHQMPTTKGEKCLHACIGENLGLVRTNSTNSIDFFLNCLNFLRFKDSRQKNQR